MKRRTFVVGAGGIGAVTIGGLALTGSAAAEAEPGVYGITEEASIDTNNGRLQSLTLSNVRVVAAWSGFDAPATGASWELEATVDGETHTIGTAETEIDESEGRLEGEVTAAMADEIELLEYFDVEDFAVPAGEDVETKATESFDITFTITACVDADDGSEVEGSLEGDSIVTITNLPAEVDTGVDGDLDGEGEDGDDGEDGVDDGDDDDDGTDDDDDDDDDGDGDHPDDDTEVVWEGAEGTKVKQKPFPPFPVKIVNYRDEDVYVVVDWKHSGPHKYFVEAEGKTGWVTAKDGEPYESDGDAHAATSSARDEDVVEPPVEADEEP